MAREPELTVDGEAIREAHRRICDVVHETPVLSSRTVDERVAATVHFKCENFQRVGAFKFRGATNAVRLLEDAEAAQGVVTHSSGNHAQALALAAQQRGIPAWIVMPEGAPAVKRAAVEGYGATVVDCANTVDAREAKAEEVREATGATFIHPYDDDRIIAGAGTAALELHGRVKHLDAVIAPVGGGGLLSGTAIATRAVTEGCRVIAAEPANADDAHRSFASGQVEAVSPRTTIADGLRTPLCARTLAYIREHVSRVHLVEEAEIRAALRFALERLKIVIEPSAAVAIAALFALSDELAGKRVGVILSGGNLELDGTPWMREGGR